MKYIKTFEKVDKPKRYLLEKSESSQNSATWWYYIWEIKAYHKKYKMFYILKRYTLTPWLKLIDENDEADEAQCDESALLDGIIMQSDNIQDLLDELQIIIDAGKYNL